MSADEKRLAREMHFGRNISRAEIAKTLNRNLSSVCRLLAQEHAPAPIGRPPALKDDQIDKLCKLLEKMVDEAEAEYEVSLAMLMKRARLKVSSRVVANALHARGYRFRDLRHKPILTPADIKERFQFAKKYKACSPQWWQKTVHIHLDNHMFKAASTGAGRKLLAKRGVRGVYRKIGKSLRAGHVKPNPKMSLNTGVKGFLKTGGVGGGQVLVWNTIEGRWGGDAAAQLYAQIVTPALKARYPGQKRYCILEDNDPTGNRSKKGIDAKRSNKLEVLRIPKRSPELNVLDYAIWSEVERRMRSTERKWPIGKEESRVAYGKRLDRTARRLPAAFINKSIGWFGYGCHRLSPRDTRWPRYLPRCRPRGRFFASCAPTDAHMLHWLYFKDPHPESIGASIAVPAAIDYKTYKTYKT